MQPGKLECFWDPAGKWIKAHGDLKSSVRGKFFTETMKTTGDKPVYRVRVMEGSSVALEAFEMLNEAEPSDDEVVGELKCRV